MKQNFSGMKLKNAMALIGKDQFTKWNLEARSRPPTETL